MFHIDLQNVIYVFVIFKKITNTFEMNVLKHDNNDKY